MTITVTLITRFSFLPCLTSKDGQATTDSPPSIILPETTKTTTSTILPYFAPTATRVPPSISICAQLVTEFAGMYFLHLGHQVLKCYPANRQLLMVMETATATPGENNNDLPPLTLTKTTTIGATQPPPVSTTETITTPCLGTVG